LLRSSRNTKATRWPSWSPLVIDWSGVG